LVLTVAACAAALIPLVFWLLPERPADAGLAPYGAVTGAESAAQRRAAIRWLRHSGRWLARCASATSVLFATFFVCGFNHQRLVGTHLIALCATTAIAEVQAASLLALMGFFDLFGTTASGWLTDRVDPPQALVCYYGARGLSLIYLPFPIFPFTACRSSPVFYGLD